MGSMAGGSRAARWSHLGHPGRPRTSGSLKTFLGKGALGGTGWEKPGALVLQPEDFELLGLEALLSPAAGGPTDTSSPQGRLDPVCTAWSKGGRWQQSSTC